MDFLKVMIVEDDILLSTLSKMFIKELGYEPTEVYESGDAALNNIERVNPDIIFMDIHLQGELDGIDTSRNIFEKFDNLPVIYLSGELDVSTIKRMLTHPFYGYLQKPFDGEKFNTAIRLARNKHNNVQIDMPALIMDINEVILYNDNAGKFFNLSEKEQLDIYNFIKKSAAEDLKHKIDEAIKQETQTYAQNIYFYNTGEFNTIFVTPVFYKFQKAVYLTIK